MAKYTMELRELISTFVEDEVKSWFEQYELSDYLTPEDIAVINQRGLCGEPQVQRHHRRPRGARLPRTRPYHGTDGGSTIQGGT